MGKKMTVNIFWQGWLEKRRAFTNPNHQNTVLITSHKRIEETLVDRLTGRWKERVTEHYGRFTDDWKNHQELRYLHEGINHGGNVKYTVDWSTEGKGNKASREIYWWWERSQKLRYLGEGTNLYFRRPINRLFSPFRHGSSPRQGIWVFGDYPIICKPPIMLCYLFLPLTCQPCISPFLHELSVRLGSWVCGPMNTTTVTTNLVPANIYP